MFCPVRGRTLFLVTAVDMATACGDELKLLFVVKNVMPLARYKTRAMTLFARLPCSWMAKEEITMHSNVWPRLSQRTFVLRFCMANLLNAL